MKWRNGVAPVAVVMLSLNEAHNMDAVLKNLSGWAQEVFLVDSYSADGTIDIALQYGVHVVQRKFRNFGDQWNFALQKLPVKAKWVMKIDPDERLTDQVKLEIENIVKNSDFNGYYIDIRLFFMTRSLPVKLSLLRLWRNGTAVMSNVSVNEHLHINGEVSFIRSEIEHHDSPDLAHWLEKQNRYTTAEAIIAFQRSALADTPRLLGTPLQRRMWLKRHFYQVPGRYFLFFLYCWLWQGAWRSGWVGYAWARLRADVMRLVEYKRREMEITGRLPISRPSTPGAPDPRVPQYD